MKKRFLAGLMAMCLVLTLLPASALAAGPEEDGTKENPWDVSAEGNGNEVYAYLTENNSVEGTYGDTVTLSFGGYTLHIEGTGDTRDFIGENTPPWNDKKTSITAIWIGDGVTSIGSGALSGATSLTTINGNNTKETGGPGEGKIHLLQPEETAGKAACPAGSRRRCLPAAGAVRGGGLF